MTPPRVLVLMAAYQGAPWIVDQLLSILEQRDVQVHVHVRDDRSMDGTLELIEARFLGDERVSFESSDTASGSAGENFRRLIRSTESGDYDFVAFADQDDIWRPEKLMLAVDCLQRTGAQAYSSAVEAFWADGRLRRLAQCTRQRAADFLFEGAGQGCTFVLTRAFFCRVQRLISQYPAESPRMHYHDWQVYIAARAGGDAWFFDPRPSMAYRQHDFNELGARSGRSSIVRRVEKIRDGWFSDQVEAALAFYRVAGGRHPQVERFAQLFHSKPSPRRRIAMMAFMLMHGRRRFSDRCILGISALAGWL